MEDDTNESNFMAIRSMNFHVMSAKYFLWQIFGADMKEDYGNGK